MDNYLKDPLKYYACETTDSFTNAITRALSLKSIIYEINTEEMISKLEILEKGSDPTHLCIFATNIQHVDPVTKSNHELVSHKVASKQENKTVLAIVTSSDNRYFYECDHKSSFFKINYI